MIVFMAIVAFVCFLFGWLTATIQAWFCVVEPEPVQRKEVTSYLCPDCNWAFCWEGGYLSMPPCPKCGTRPDRSVLQMLHIPGKNISIQG